jgi:hypothetical protein
VFPRSLLFRVCGRCWEATTRPTDEFVAAGSRTRNILSAKIDLTLPTDRLENIVIVRSVQVPISRLLQFTRYPRAEESE